VLGVTRGELEMYVRYLESRGYAAATVARRLGTVATFYKYAVIDGVIAANPAATVTRPKVAWEGHKRTVLHPLEFAALLAAARTSGPNDHALVCLLGMLGLRVSEACASDITDIRFARCGAGAAEGTAICVVCPGSARPTRARRAFWS
jgi:integrase/recombinase XerD